MAKGSHFPSEVHSVYVVTRGWAQGVSVRTMRWRTRWIRRRHMLDQLDRARLKAIGDELSQRGVR